MAVVGAAFDESSRSNDTYSDCAASKDAILAHVAHARLAAAQFRLLKSGKIEMLVSEPGHGHRGEENENSRKGCSASRSVGRRWRVPACGPTRLKEKRVKQTNTRKRITRRGEARKRERREREQRDGTNREKEGACTERNMLHTTKANVKAGEINTR